MQKLIIFSLFQIALGILNSFGQNYAQTPVYLSNYSFSKEQNDVGYVKIRSANGTRIKSISIEGEHAIAFRLSKDFKLSINKQKINPGINWFDVVFKVETPEGARRETFRIVRDQFIHNKVIA